MVSMTLIDEFVVAFDVWEEARPYIGMMVRDDEMQLVVGMQGQAMTPAEVGELFDMPPAEAARWLHACYARHIVDKAESEGQVTYSPGTFYTRLDRLLRVKAKPGTVIILNQIIE